MYYGSGSVPRIASSSRRKLQRRMSETLCAYSRWQHFYALNYVMAAILKVYSIHYTELMVRLTKIFL